VSGYKCGDATRIEIPVLLRECVTRIEDAGARCRHLPREKKKSARTDVVLPRVINGRQLAKARQAKRPGIRTLYVRILAQSIVQPGRLDRGRGDAAKNRSPVLLAQVIQRGLDGHLRPILGRRAKPRCFNSIAIRR